MWVWNKCVLWWHRLWIRKDEFHRSLDLDSLNLDGMSKQKKEEYLIDLNRRREIAHRRDH